MLLLFLLCVSGCSKSLDSFIVTESEAPALTPEIIIHSPEISIAMPENKTDNHTPPPPSPVVPEPPTTPEAVPDTHTYEINARVHDSMPEYRFVATGLDMQALSYLCGFIFALDGYDENGSKILSADFSELVDGELSGFCVYNEMMDTMGLHVVDVNFDGYKDVIILNNFSGVHGNTWYNCWLWDAESSAFVESKTFGEICNPALDAEKQCIYSAGGSGAAYWGGRIYKFIDGEFVLTNELYTDWDDLVETMLIDDEMIIVRQLAFGEGEEIYLAEREYYKNSELWQLEHPRWYWLGGHHADEWLS